MSDRSQENQNQHHLLAQKYISCQNQAQMIAPSTNNQRNLYKKCNRRNRSSFKRNSIQFKFERQKQKTFPIQFIREVFVCAKISNYVSSAVCHIAKHKNLILFLPTFQDTGHSNGLSNAVTPVNVPNSTSLGVFNPNNRSNSLNYSVQRELGGNNDEEIQAPLLPRSKS